MVKAVDGFQSSSDTIGHRSSKGEVGESELKRTISNDTD